MSNTYFRFKQFNIDQDKCAMKVTTDACILGAWVPLMPQARRVLDIGTGTGLLALMLAQRVAGIEIDAVELDEVAASQAAENSGNSQWKDRINVLACDVRHYAPSHKYDLIISNPPFFNNSLLSNKNNKNLARHTGSLSYSDLSKAIYNNLLPHGYAAVLLPCPEYYQFIEVAAQCGLYESCRLEVRHSLHTEVKRMVTILRATKQEQGRVEELIIKDGKQNYTPAFKLLLAPFYLDL